MIPLAPFGRTGQLSTRTLFGAAAFWSTPQKAADAVLELLLHFGVNHIDAAASYGDAELRVGPWMPRYRDRFFLATKTEERTKQGAWASLRRSLERLQTDHVDLFQIHNLSDPQEWQVALGPGGALEAFVAAREQGLTRFIGITGHGLNIAALHRRALDRFDFDSVLLPYSYILLQNPQYAAEVATLLQVCRERNVAVQTIKGITRAPWHDKPHTRNTWYAPLENQADIDQAVHWVLGNPNAFLNTAADVQLLPKILDAASRFTTQPSDTEMRTLLTEQAMEPLFV
ncbi:1-deoxyxylulose-5-phosphate synthase YajO [Thermoflexales bacterium]|nr:1-deoxyxylulose-5-phosphate synthase YajO [Thermoflexales bacterium]